MRWKRTKLSVIGAGIFGASNLTTPKPESVAQTVEWASPLSSSTGILSASLGRVSSIRKRLPNQYTKINQFSPAFEPVVTLTASIQNISKSLSLLVK
jgi:hypothetical protein